MKIKAYLQLTLTLIEENRPAVNKVYGDLHGPFLGQVKGARMQQLLAADGQHIQILHGFGKANQAEEYLESDLYRNTVYQALRPLCVTEPEVRVFEVAVRH